MNTNTEEQWIESCLREIENKLNWGSSATWHSDVFSELSELIHKETAVLLSATTLKRIWGKVEYSSSPSINTLNTLSQFLGHKNWRDYKNENQAQSRAKEQNQAENRKWLSRQGIIITSAAFLTLAFISLFSLMAPNQGPDLEEIAGVEFSSKPLAEGIPNSVVFQLDLGPIESDNIRIQQYWDETKTIDISAGQKEATGIYYRPGYFRSKLIVDEQIIREHDLYIKSNGWLGTIDYEPVPKYYNESKIHHPAIQLPDEALMEIKNSKERLISSFHYVEDFKNLSGDNFRLSTTLQNIYNDKWAICQSTYIYILGSKSALLVPFCIQGCVSDIHVMMSEVFVSGKEKDLSAFAVDLSTPKDIEVRVVDKKMQVFVDELKIFEGQYNESIGKLAGIRIRFLGAGRVSDLTLSDSDGQSYLDF